MSDEEQQAPTQTQEEVKPEHPDTINVKVCFPVQRVSPDWFDENFCYAGSHFFGRGSVLQDQAEYEAQ
jgi:hypothetical protein